MNIEMLLEWKDQGMSMMDISDVTGLDYSTVRYHHVKNGVIPNKGRVALNIERIKNTLDLDGQYIIGFLAADGYLNRNRSVDCFIQERDSEVLVRILNFFNLPLERIRSRVNSNGCKLLGIRLGSVELVGYLTQFYGFSNQKSLTLPFPSWLQNPLPFLRGFMDGDGYIGYGCTFSSSSPFFVNGLLTWVDSVYSYHPNCQLVGVNKTCTNINFRKKHEQFIRDLFSYPGLTRKTEAYNRYLPNQRDRSRG